MKILFQKNPFQGIVFLSKNQANTPSRPVTSNQNGPHEHVTKIVNRQLKSVFRKPVADHNQVAFDEAQQKIRDAGKPLILDSCCGIGESSRHLARSFPDHFIVGVDKSSNRLTRETGEDLPGNLCLVRADLVDFWRLAAEANWHPVRHYLLYPNPWPKAEHLKRRWHAMPVFRQIVTLGGMLELRSNWPVYLQEFALALAETGINATPEVFCPDQPITPFERKYSDSGQTLWRMMADLSAAKLPEITNKPGG